MFGGTWQVTGMDPGSSIESAACCTSGWLSDVPWLRPAGRHRSCGSIIPCWANVTDGSIGTSSVTICRRCGQELPTTSGATAFLKRLT
ncbi:hypothetical protein BC834DRAFT_657420 [Gloeopeniophorella convolvens]|nr:hypothetical protein BC834DRAFT_657420 [Gloeopeniophorella convolvens]